ncbi:MAG: ParA family protein [Mariprofundaceae bacterium]|nr:ParA family protein [Mariprofundaceae bacterium]
MRVITLMNQKGGVGKTTLALSLAARWHLAGFSVAVIDCDPQGSSVYWKRQQVENSPLIGIKVYAVKLPSEVRSCRALDADYVLLDTPGTDKSTVRAAIHASDALIIPVQASAIDVDASYTSLEAGLDADKPIAYILNRYIQQSILGEDTKKALKTTPATIIDKVMNQYQDFPRSIGLGETPTTMFPGQKAAQNIEAIGQAIDQWLIQCDQEKEASLVV